MSAFHLSQAARESLKSIGRYTEKMWGRAQRKKYLEALDNRFHDLAAAPEKGRSREALIPGLRSYQEGHHIIFYIVDTEGIIIADILHERMEPALHLKPKA